MLVCVLDHTNHVPCQGFTERLGVHQVRIFSSLVLFVFLIFYCGFLLYRIQVLGNVNVHSQKKHHSTDSVRFKQLEQYDRPVSKFMILPLRHRDNCPSVLNDSDFVKTIAICIFFSCGVKNVHTKNCHQRTECHVCYTHRPISQQVYTLTLAPP